MSTGCYPAKSGQVSGPRAGDKPWEQPERQYSASLSQNQGRSGFSMIFRHPTRRDASGRAGVRVRRGLGTRDRAEAERLREQLNELLGGIRWHAPTARADAEHRFDQRVVEMFYDKMIPEQFDFASVREQAIPLPSQVHDGYRHILLLGTTGAGKTTLIRQLIGTDPRERFPSTSTARTTVHDTEIVIDDGPWRAVVTFISSDELREYLNECISAAVLAAWRRETFDQVLQRLLIHVNQRHRFNYILGNGPQSTISDFDEDDEGDQDDEEDNIERESSFFTPDNLDDLDLSATNNVLDESVERLRDLARRLGEQLQADLKMANETDQRVLDEYFEDALDNLLRDEDDVHEIADELISEIERRFDLLSESENIKMRYTKQGWPLAWEGRWDAGDRQGFLKAISRFSSNHAPLFGRLLTPLVSGMRVAGPFRPTWADGRRMPLVLLDGEGLGHTPKSSAAVSTSVSERIEKADAILLVDNATQPMLAAPVAAMREIAATGNARKLIITFTHFDQVKGDNLSGTSARARHVLESAENVMRAIGQDLGTFAERALRKRLDTARVFLGGIQKSLGDRKKADLRTIKQLKRMVDEVEKVAIEPLEPGEARPIYDRADLALAVNAAAEQFREAWYPRLGLNRKPGMIKEHWARIKALTRRLATGMSDEYDSLKPVASLKAELRDQIYLFIQRPIKWEGGEPSDDDKQVVYDMIADDIAGRVARLATSRVWVERIREWQSAYDERGRGSTFVRAHIIGEQIYERAAPAPSVVPSPSRNELLRLVTAEFEAACGDQGARLL